MQGGPRKFWSDLLRSGSRATAEIGSGVDEVERWVGLDYCTKPIPR
jgi:hypothetical protein